MDDGSHGVDENHRMRREPDKKEKRDIRTLARFVAVYCGQHHADGTSFSLPVSGLDNLFRSVELCPECTGLLRYGLSMRLRCPLDPKPMRKKCPNPCYKPEYRDKVREAMRFSGMHLIKRGRIDLLFHYFR